MMRVACQTQRTREWLDAKRGKVGASQLWRAMAKLKVKSKNGSAGDPSGECLKYMLELATEITTGFCVDHWVSPEMDYGSQYENLAIREYLFANDQPECMRTGFVLHPTLDRWGSSPDLVLERGGVEAKVPKAMTHQTYRHKYIMAKLAGLSGNALAEAVIPEKYLYQVHSCIICCERDWWDWISFCPPDPERIILPPDQRLLQIRVERDQGWVDAIEKGVIEFNGELLELTKLMGGEAMPNRLNEQLRKSVEPEPVSESAAYAAAAEYIDKQEMAP